MTRDRKGFYAVLGINSSASPDAIEEAFLRRIAEVGHSSSGSHDAERLLEAFRTLSDSRRRAIYDFGVEEVRKRPTVKAALLHGARSQFARLRLRFTHSTYHQLQLGISPRQIFRFSPLFAAALYGFWLLVSESTGSESTCPAATIYNGQELRRTAYGPHEIEINNGGTRGAIFVMRSESGESAATVYIAAYGSTTINQFPPGTFRPEFLFGDYWSNRCQHLVGHLAARRFPEFDVFSSNRNVREKATYTITPVANGNIRPVGMNPAEFRLD